MCAVTCMGKPRFVSSHPNNYMGRPYDLIDLAKLIFLYKGIVL